MLQFDLADMMCYVIFFVLFGALFPMNFPHVVSSIFKECVRFEPRPIIKI